MADSTKNKNGIAQPPEPTIAIRTMASDIQTLKMSGGQFITATQVIGSAGRNTTGSNGSGFVLESAIETRPLNIEKPKSESKWSIGKTLFVIASIILIILGAGLLGYFVVFTWLFK